MFRLSVTILVGALVALTSANLIIESEGTTDWGVWGAWSRCPFGRFAQAMQFRTEPYQGAGTSDDDTAGNAIRLYCGDPYNASTAIITSTEGEWGPYGNTYVCRQDGRPLAPDGYIAGFQLRAESSTLLDNTATNNIRVVCRYSDGSEQILEADGLTYGSWRSTLRCDANQSVCAIQTQVETWQEDSDDTALNNVAMECCDR